MPVRVRMGGASFAEAVRKLYGESADRDADFNDLHQSEGLNIVKTQIEAATPPIETDDELFHFFSLILYRPVLLI